MNEGEKATKEEKYLLAIPIVITFMCAFLDWWCASRDGAYIGLSIMKYVENILRLVIGYFFPSLISLSFTMILQCSVFGDDIIGINRNYMWQTVAWTVAYAFFFVLCLSQYNIITAIIFIILSVIYILIFNNNCLDERIQFKNLKIFSTKYKNKPNE